MGFKEINFEISPLKEKELFRYIIEECNCQIFNPVVENLDEAVYNEKSEINSLHYVIKGMDFKPQYKWTDTFYDKGQYYVFDFSSDTENIDYMYVSYERMPSEEDSNKSHNRLFISFAYPTDLKNEYYNNFKKIKKWIKSHTQTVERFGRLPIYCIY